MSDGEPHTTSIPISYSKILSSFRWLDDWGEHVGGFVRGCQQGRFEGFTGIERGRLNDNIDTANQTYEGSMFYPLTYTPNCSIFDDLMTS